MSAKSLELLAELTKRGTISKEAADETLALRERLIQASMVKMAAGGFSRLRPIGKAVGGVYDAIKSRLGHGGFSPSTGPAGPPGWSDVASNLTKMLGLATLTAAASSGIGGFMKRRKDRAMQSDIESSYQRMQDLDPNMRQLMEDPTKVDAVKRTFGVLARFAPSLAAEPMVAAAFVSQMATGPGVIHPEHIKALAETQRKIDEMQDGRSGISTHFDRGINLAQRAMSPSAPSAGKGGKP